MLNTRRRKNKIKVDPKLTDSYKGKTLFKDKYDWAVNHVKDRDIEKEIEEALEMEKITES